MSLNFKMDTINSCYDVKFEWTITNFSRSAKLVESAPFFPIPGRSSKWLIQLEFTQSIDGFYFIMCVKIRSLDKTGTAPPLNTEGNIIIENNQGCKWTENHFNLTIKANSVTECYRSVHICGGLPFHFSEIFSLPNDVFVLKCNLKTYIPRTFVISKSKLPSVKVEKYDILNAIYKKKSHTDFTFHFADGVLRAHKAILSERSPVFEKMFEHDTQEQKTNSATIKDFDLIVFDCFLTFLYTGKIKDDLKPDLEMFLKLYELSDKYDVKHLHQYCSDILLRNYLDDKTVIRILEVTDLHNDSLLKTHVMEYFRHRFNEIAMTEEWKRLLTENVRLASEVLSFITSVLSCKNTS